MKPYTSFKFAMERAKRYLAWYSVLHDTRVRNARKEWADGFRDLMHWSATEPILRIDSEGAEGILVLRGSKMTDRKDFQHEYLSELLRSAIVAAVSSLDRYMHDMVVESAWGLLGQAEARIPKSLKELPIQALDAKRAIEKLRKDPNARPGNTIKAAIQRVLHEDTFQGPGGIEKAINMLGINNFWAQVVAILPGSPKVEDVKKKLNELVRRRNFIVHEADTIRKIRAKKTTLRDITYTETKEQIEWLEQLVAAINQILP